MLNHNINISVRIVLVTFPPGALLLPFIAPALAPHTLSGPAPNLLHFHPPQLPLSIERLDIFQQTIRPFDFAQGIEI